MFELLTATYAADNFNLRDDWVDRRAALADYRVLDEFPATDFLQIVSLLATRDRRERYIADSPDAERAPAVSCKRRDVLRLSLDDYRHWADETSKALVKVVRFLHGEAVFTADDLPYASQIVPLTAIYVAVGDRAETHAVTELLRRWYWCGVFGEMYGGSTETRVANDLQDVVAWVPGGSEPRTVRESQFQASRLLTLRTRNSAAYKGLYAHQMKRGGRDFRSGRPIDLHANFDDQIDVHHIFPKKWCAEAKVPDWVANSIVNKTSIDSRTNRRIGGRSPSRYLELIESREGTAGDELDAILRSHDIDPVALRTDDFAAFFSARFERLITQIEDATGKPVNRAADDNPYAHTDTHEITTERIRALAARGESKVVEFKSTAVRNLRTGEKDVEIEMVVVKTVAGFMNTDGGTLLIGVADDGSVVGIEQDFAVQGGKKNADGWELRLTELLVRTLGQSAGTGITIRYGTLDGRTVAEVDVAQAARPVFVTHTKGERRPAFYVRMNSSTRELSGPDAHDHQRRRWPV